MALRIFLAKNDPLQTTFFCTERSIHYSSDTVMRDKACGIAATTTVTRRNVHGDSHIGIVEWPVNPFDRPAVVLKSRTIEMIKTGLYTYPEKFQASDREWYEWRICDSRAQLVPIRAVYTQAYIATFIVTSTGNIFNRKSRLFILRVSGGRKNNQSLGRGTQVLPLAELWVSSQDEPEIGEELE